MDRLENMVLSDVEYTEEMNGFLGTAQVSVDGDADVVVYIFGGDREVVKALFAALEVGLGF